MYVCICMSAQHSRSNKKKLSRKISMSPKEKEHLEI